MAQDLPETFGRYRIARTLGEGAMGAVYLARDTQLDRLVALKVPKLQERVPSRPEGLRPDRTAPQSAREEGAEEKETPDSQTLERFFREARAAAALNHPNICAIHDIGEIDGIPFLTMSYLEGRTLAELVERDKPMDQDQASAIVCTLARAMQEAHSRGVIHRDLKPSNVMITGRGVPVIMDFGIARLDEPVEHRLTQAGAILGTPAYMAPEQIEGNPDAVGRACDIYSLGVILYELLTARIPFSGSVASMLGKILHVPPEPPSRHRPGLNPALEAVCLKAMAKRPQDRYPSMADLASALEECLPRPPQSETMVKPNRAWAKAAPVAPSGIRTRRRALLTGGAVCLAAALAGLLFHERFHLATSIPTPARSGPPRPDRREDVAVAATDGKSLPSSTPTAGPGSISSPREGPGPTANDGGSLTQAKPLASPVQAPKQTSQPPTTSPSSLMASTAAPKPDTSRSGSDSRLKTLTDSIGIKLILIPAGTFQMGSVNDEAEADARPAHEVRISRPFYMGIHEVTQGQYRAVMGSNPSWFSIEGASQEKKKGPRGDRRPVESVTWFEAVRFCNALSMREKLKPFYATTGADVRVPGWTGVGYRLPTEAEWEYACRAGSRTRYFFGNDPSELVLHAWFGEAYEKGAHPVGRKLPNAWGLFDMHGNVGEWCWDWYDRTYYKTSPQTDPTGPEKGAHRVYRGGGFDHPAASLDVADRAAKAPTVRHGGLGFRVVRTAVAHSEE